MKSKQLILWLWLTGIAINAFAQTPAEYVPFVRESGFLGHDWYSQQAAKWQQHTKAAPDDVMAWRNLYLATEYSYFGSATPEKREKLSEIITAMQHNAPNAPETLYLRYRFDPSDAAPLLEAHRRAPDLPEPLYSLIVRSDMTGDTAEFERLLVQLYHTADVPAALLDYNYNMLMSCAEGAILFTNGDNDTYPAWILQQAKDIRTDISVWNSHLLRANSDYLLRKLNERFPGIVASELPHATEPTFWADLVKLLERKNAQIPVYFAVTIDQEILKPLNKELFLTGLVYRFSNQRFDNLDILRQNWHHFRLDYIFNDWNAETDVSRPLVDNVLNQNYLPAALILLEDATENGLHAHAGRYRRFILTVAKKAGVLEAVKEQIQNTDG